MRWRSFWRPTGYWKVTWPCRQRRCGPSALLPSDLPTLRVGVLQGVGGAAGVGCSKGLGVPRVGHSVGWVLQGWVSQGFLRVGLSGGWVLQWLDALRASSGWVLDSGWVLSVGFSKGECSMVGCSKGKVAPGVIAPSVSSNGELQGLAAPVLDFPRVGAPLTGCCKDLQWLDAPTVWHSKGWELQGRVLKGLGPPEVGLLQGWVLQVSLPIGHSKGWAVEGLSSPRVGTPVFGCSEVLQFLSAPTVGSSKGRVAPAVHAQVSSELSEPGSCSAP